MVLIRTAFALFHLLYKNTVTRYRLGYNANKLIKYCISGDYISFLGAKRITNVYFQTFKNVKLNYNYNYGVPTTTI